MKQEQVLHEKQKTKMRHKNISWEHLSFTNFDPKLRAKTDTDSKLIKLLNDFCRTKKFASSCADRITKTKNWWLQNFHFFLQSLNSNFRLSVNRALILLLCFRIFKLACQPIRSAHTLCISAKTTGHIITNIGKWYFYYRKLDKLRTTLPLIVDMYKKDLYF